ncbi:MAG: hypothetical protein ACUVRD_05450 [Bacteroidia bacterium]
MEGYDKSQPLIIDPLISTYLVGGDNNRGYALAVDASGHVYVTGRTESRSFPTAVGAFDPTHNGYSNIFVFKLSPDGSSLLYSTYLGGMGMTGAGHNRGSKWS